jgi:hypothetical protein
MGPARRLTIVSAITALSGGCVAPGPFPSLAPREAEREISVDDTLQKRPAVPIDAALGARIAALLSDARRSEAAFAAALGAAEAAAGRAGTEGSETWIAAQQAVSAAEAARAPTVGALAELDGLSLERAGMATDQSQFEALLAAVAEAQRFAEGQQRRLDVVRARLSR